MSTIDHPAVYDNLLDLLAESVDAKRVLAFHLSDEKQAGWTNCSKRIGKAH
jgi:hypothetical protein